MLIDLPLLLGSEGSAAWAAWVVWADWACQKNLTKPIWDGQRLIESMSVRATISFTGTRHIASRRCKNHCFSFSFGRVLARTLKFCVLRTSRRAPLRRVRPAPRAFASYLIRSFASIISREARVPTGTLQIASRRCKNHCFPLSFGRVLAQTLKLPAPRVPPPNRCTYSFAAHN